MPRLQHESEPLEIRDYADYPAYYRFSIVTASGSGHLADVACYDGHPDNDPASSGEPDHRHLDPRAHAHAVLFANAVRMYHLLHRLLSFIPPDDDLPEADAVAEARALLARMEADACSSGPEPRALQSMAEEAHTMFDLLLEAVPGGVGAADFPRWQRRAQAVVERVLGPDWLARRIGGG
jgi:hypothetical protein